MLSAENEVLYPLHHLVDQLPCVLWSTDLKLRLTTVLGAIPWPVDGCREPVIGKTLYDLCGVDASSHPIVLWHLAAIAGQRQSLREQVGERWYDAVLEPLREPSGRIIGCAGAAVDITERHRIEESLLRSEERLAAAQRLAHVGSFEWDYKLDAVIWSDEMYRIYGIDPADFGGTFADFAANIPPEDMAELKARLFGAVHEKGTHSFDHRIVRRDGQVRILHTVCGSTFDEDGAPVRLVGSCWDVTELREATSALERSVSLQRATLDATADGILVVDREGRVATSNERFRVLWGLSEQLIAKGADDALLDAVQDQLEEPDAFLREVRDHYADPELESFTVLRFKDGRVFERYSRPQRIRSEVVGRVWSFRDVTERERLLARAELLADASRLLGSLDLEKAVESVAKLALPMLGEGCVVDLFEGSKPRRLFAFSRAREVPISCELRAPVCAGHSTTYSVGQINFLSVPMLVGGTVVGAITFVSAPHRSYHAFQIELAEELGSRIASAIEGARLHSAAQQALRTRADFLSVVCHEIRTPLTSIHLAVQKLALTVPDGSRMRLYDRIIREDRRLARLVDHLVDFGKLQAGGLRFELETINLAHVVHTVTERLAADIASSGSEISTALDEATVGEWDRARLEQVVANLLSNAVKFGMGKPIQISLSKTDDNAFLEITDHGIGIAPELRDRIFEPFERPAPVRHFGGLGLGLYVARSIVEGLGGRMRVESQPDRATTFFVELPRRRPT